MRAEVGQAPLSVRALTHRCRGSVNNFVQDKVQGGPYWGQAFDPTNCRGTSPASGVIFLPRCSSINESLAVSGKTGGRSLEEAGKILLAASRRAHFRPRQ
jgi:hypothetical protein